MARTSKTLAVAMAAAFSGALCVAWPDPAPAVTPPTVPTVPTVPTAPTVTVTLPTVPRVTVPTVPTVPTAPTVTLTVPTVPPRPTTARPAVTVPPVSRPTLPAATLPPATLPPATLPPATLPAATLPPATLPAATLPPATLPATLPPATLPAATLATLPPPPSVTRPTVPTPAGAAATPTLPRPNIPPPPAPPPLKRLAERRCRSECAVPKERRALVFVNYVRNASRYKPLYRFFEAAGRAVVQAELGRHYGRVVEITDNGTLLDTPELSNLSRHLFTLESDPDIDAIDVILVLHGSPGSLEFAADVKDGPTTVDMANLRQRLDDPLDSPNCHLETGRISDVNERNAAKAACLANGRRKLRAVFNTACYGATHSEALRNAGFDAVMGSQGVYADSIASFPAMMEAWGKGYTFEEAVIRGNQADPRRSYDRWAQTLGFADVNSTRSVSGNAALTIWSAPTD